MKPPWDVFVRQLRETVEKWTDVELKLPLMLALQNPPGSAIPKEGITKSLLTTFRKLEAVNSNSEADPIMVVTHQPGIQGQIAALHQTVINAVSNPATLNPQTCQALVGTLWSLHASLVWFPPTAAETMEAIAADSSLAGDNLRVLGAAAEITENAEKSRAALLASNQASQEIKQLLETIRGHERESGTAKNNADASAASAKSNQDASETMFAKLSEGVQQQAELLSSINTLKDQAEAALQGASQMGLAHSFAKNHRQLEWKQRGWAVIFLVGIVGLVFIEHHAVAALNDYPRLLTHALVGLPLVWLTWFAARQYAQDVRLAEDYSFKEASALAFYGYHREMAEDPEMVALLRQAAIHNFGANPVRILGKQESVSPMHHFLETLLERARPEQVLEVMASLGKRDK